MADTVLVTVPGIMGNMSLATAQSLGLNYAVVPPTPAPALTPVSVSLPPPPPPPVAAPVSYAPPLDPFSYIAPLNIPVSVPAQSLVVSPAPSLGSTLGTGTQVGTGAPSYVPAPESLPPTPVDYSPPLNPFEYIAPVDIPVSLPAFGVEEKKLEEEEVAKKTILGTATDAVAELNTSPIAKLVGAGAGTGALAGVNPNPAADIQNTPIGQLESSGGIFTGSLGIGLAGPSAPVVNTPVVSEVKIPSVFSNIAATIQGMASEAQAKSEVVTTPKVTTPVISGPAPISAVLGSSFVQKPAVTLPTAITPSLLQAALANQPSAVSLKGPSLMGQTTPIIDISMPKVSTLASEVVIPSALFNPSGPTAQDIAQQVSGQNTAVGKLNQDIKDFNERWAQNLKDDSLGVTPGSTVPVIKQVFVATGSTTLADAQKAFHSDWDKYTQGEYFSGNKDEYADYVEAFNTLKDLRAAQVVSSGSEYEEYKGKMGELQGRQESLVAQGQVVQGNLATIEGLQDKITKAGGLLPAIVFGGLTGDEAIRAGYSAADVDSMLRMRDNIDARVGPSGGATIGPRTSSGSLDTKIGGVVSSIFNPSSEAMEDKYFQILAEVAAAYPSLTDAQQSVIALAQYNESESGLRPKSILEQALTIKGYEFAPTIEALPGMELQRTWPKLSPWEQVSGTTLTALAYLPLAIPAAKGIVGLVGRESSVVSGIEKLSTEAIVVPTTKVTSGGAVGEVVRPYVVGELRPVGILGEGQRVLGPTQMLGDIGETGRLYGAGLAEGIPLGPKSVRLTPSTPLIEGPWSSTPLKQSIGVEPFGTEAIVTTKPTSYPIQAAGAKNFKQLFGFEPVVKSPAPETLFGYKLPVETVSGETAEALGLGQKVGQTGWTIEDIARGFKEGGLGTKTPVGKLSLGVTERPVGWTAEEVAQGYRVGPGAEAQSAIKAVEDLYQPGGGGGSVVKGVGGTSEKGYGAGGQLTKAEFDLSMKSAREANARLAAADAAKEYLAQDFRYPLSDLNKMSNDDIIALANKTKAQTKPKVATETAEATETKVFVTDRDIQDLLELGYTKAEAKSFTPSQVQDIIDNLRFKTSKPTNVLGGSLGTEPYILPFSAPSFGFMALGVTPIASLASSGINVKPATLGSQPISLAMVPSTISAPSVVKVAALPQLVPYVSAPKGRVSEPSYFPGGLPSGGVSIYTPTYIPPYTPPKVGSTVVTPISVPSPIYTPYVEEPIKTPWSPGVPPKLPVEVPIWAPGVIPVTPTQQSPKKVPIMSPMYQYTNPLKIHGFSPIGSPFTEIFDTSTLSEPNPLTIGELSPISQIALGGSGPTIEEPIVSRPPPIIPPIFPPMIGTPREGGGYAWGFPATLKGGLGRWLTKGYSVSAPHPITGKMVTTNPLKKAIKYGNVRKRSIRQPAYKVVRAY